MNETPSPEPKKATQSLTVRSAMAAAFIPILSFLLARYLGMDAETSASIGAALFGAFYAFGQVGMRRAAGGFGAVLILAISVGCCSHVNHKKLATFPTIRKSFEGLKGNLKALKVKDEQDEELKALSIEECDAGIDLCKQAEAR